MHNKLVRDNIPQIIEADGHACEVTSLEPADYIIALKAKLVEESEEVQMADSSAALTTELADVLEVMISLCDAIGIPFSSVEAARATRAEARGRFGKRLFLRCVDM